MNQQTRLLLLGIVLLSSIAVAGTFLYRSKQSKTAVTTPPSMSEPSQMGGVAGLQTQASLTKNGGSTEVLLRLQPVNASQDVSTLGIEIIFKASSGNLFARSSSPSMGDAFKGNGWTIPFSDLVSNEDGTVTLKLSAIYASPNPFTLTEAVDFASVSLGGLEPGSALTYTINNPDVSKAYDKSGTLISFSKTNQPLTILE